MGRWCWDLEELDSDIAWIQNWTLWYKAKVKIFHSKYYQLNFSEECWKRLAAGSLERPQMSGGYTDKMTDVEHSAEETADPLTSLLLLGDNNWTVLLIDLIDSDPNNSTYRTWASEIIPDLALHKWTGINDRGFLQFKSTFFTSRDVSDNVLFACDTAYHARFKYNWYIS